MNGTMMLDGTRLQSSTVLFERRTNQGGSMFKHNSLCIQRSQPGGPRKSGEAPSPAQMEEMYA
jgi:hypothetical protein